MGDYIHWKQLRAVFDPPAAEVDDDEDLTLGFSLLRALAESDHTLVEIQPGVWRASKPWDAHEL